MSANPFVSREASIAVLLLDTGRVFESFSDLWAAEDATLTLDRVDAALAETIVPSATSPFLPTVSALGSPISFLALDAAVLADFLVGIGTALFVFLVAALALLFFDSVKAAE